jgi:hypothetical protein
MISIMSSHASIATPEGHAEAATYSEPHPDGLLTVRVHMVDGITERIGIQVGIAGIEPERILGDEPAELRLVVAVAMVVQPGLVPLAAGKADAARLRRAGRSGHTVRIVPVTVRQRATWPATSTTGPRASVR